MELTNIRETEEGYGDKIKKKNEEKNLEDDRREGEEKRKGEEEREEESTVDYEYMD